MSALEWYHWASHIRLESIPGILGIKGLNSNLVTIIIFFQKNWIFIKTMTLTLFKDFYRRTKVEITGDETVLLNSEFFYV